MGVLLMWRKIFAAERGAHHSGQGQMGAVEIPEPDVVEPEVVVLRQPFGSFAILPNPIAEPILQLLLFLSGGNRLLLIDGSSAFGVIVVGSRRAPIQRLLDQVGSAEAGSPIRGRVIDHVFRGVIGFYDPSSDCL